MNANPFSTPSALMQHVCMHLLVSIGPCPGCNLCGCGPLAFAPEFKKGIIAEHPDWYVGDGPMYAGRCCGGCNCCSNYSDVLKVEGKGVHYYGVCSIPQLNQPSAYGSVTHCLPCAHTSAGNMTPFCGKGICCDPPPIDKAAALKAGNAKAPMMKMMKREPYKVES